MIYSANYASSAGSGVYADKIAWINFGSSLRLLSGESTSICNILPNGYIICFKISYTVSNDSNLAGNAIYLEAVTSPNPANPSVPFGNTSYIDIPGNIILTSNTPPILGNLTCISIYDIFVLGLSCNCNNYSIIIANSDVTEVGEAFAVTTNGTPWSLINFMPPIASPIESPIFNGIGAQSTTERGISLIRNRVGAGVYSSSNPSCCTINFISNYTPESAAIGIMINEFPAPLLCDDYHDTVFVFPNKISCYKFFSEDCCPNKNFCIYLSLDGSLENALTSNIFYGTLGCYQIINDTITLTPKCALTKFSSDKLTFIITENNLRYTKTLLFIYNPCAN